MELKFRAWNTRWKEMEYFDDLYWFEENYVHGQGDNHYQISQSIGRRDKNDKKIYEGDIVQFNYRDDDDYQVSEIKEKGIIHGDFGDFDMWLIEWAMEVDCVFEVIGNIYENPELIKKEKQ